MKKLLPFCFITLFLLTSCLGGLFEKEHERITDLPRTLTAAEEQLIAADRNFGIDLFRNLSAEQESNMMISPLSVSMVLGMIVNGAAGDTRSAMKAALRKTGMDIEQINEGYRGLTDLLTGLDPAVQMNIANAIWYDLKYPLREVFMEDTRHYFEAEIEGLEFSDPASIDIMNGWVNDRTNGLIPSIIQPPIPPNVITYLMNAIYFKGNWFLPFDPDETYPEPFYTAGTEKMVDMMHHEKEQIATYDSPDVKVADLAYGDSLYSMTLIMPAEDGRPLDLFIEEDFTAGNLESWISSLTSSESILALPKFEAEYQVPDSLMEKVLSAMGMELAFSGGSDFTLMYKNGDASLDRVKHTTFIKVDEEGTEAAAVTSGVMSTSGAPLYEFNRPFIYLIRERLSGTILFIGKMTDPTAE